MITIVPFEPKYDAGINELKLQIAIEYSIENTHPNYVAPLPDAYWIALNNGSVIGTLGVIALEKNAVLKRMYLQKEFRGGEKIAGSLLETAINWCNKKGLYTVYLGTMARFIAAQRFYEKNGFQRIDATGLPYNFPANPVDDVFYMLELK